MIVTSPWASERRARREITWALRKLGDEAPLVEATVARGVLGVKTSLDARLVVRRLRELCEKGLYEPRFTARWVPIDLWTSSEVPALKEGVARLKDRVGVGEKWRMTVEKRRYTHHHSIDIIKEVAELIPEKVDLKHPDKIVEVEIIGDQAGLAVLKPDEIFSAVRLLLPSDQLL